MKPADLLQKSKQELKTVSVHPYQEGLWILAKTLNLSPNEIYLERDSVSEAQQSIFFNEIQKRKRAEPLEYILQEKIFFACPFYVERGVFIPRQETEILVQWVLKNISSSDEIKVVDFGAGAGALCLSLLSHLPNSQLAALEICSQSIKCLKKNSQSFQLEKRLHILQKDICRVQTKELVKLLGQAPSLIVANPPYIDPQDQSLSPEVYFFDPPLALFSDQGGIGHIVSWFKKAMELLSPKGIYIFELGWNQEDQVRAFCEKQTELESYKIHKDSMGYPRMAVCFKK